MTTFAIPDAAHYPNPAPVALTYAGELVSGGNPIPMSATLTPPTDITTTGTIAADQGAVTATYGAGVSSWTAYLAGTFNAGTTINFEGSIDGTNWIAINGAVVGATSDTDVSSVVGGAAVAYQGNASGMTKVRMRAHPFAGGDSVTVTIIGSQSTDGGFLTKSLPAGSAVIGSVTLQAVSGTALLADASNTELRTSLYGKQAAAGDTAVAVDASGFVGVNVKNANSNGQNTMVNSAPIAIASDQSAVKGKQDFLETAGVAAGSVTSTSTPIITSIDVSAYKSWSFQMSGTWTMTLQPQFSNDNTNWFAGYLFQSASASPAQTLTANGLYWGPILGRYMRIIPTAWTSNASGVGTLETYTYAIAHNGTYANQQGVWTVQPGNTQNTTPWLTQGPTNNSTAAANAGTGKAIKASAGALWSAVVTATGTAATTLYDNASTSSGTALLTIPANAAVGTIYSFPGGAPAANGIYADQVANAPSITVFYR